MARRGGTLQFTCQEAGCREFALVDYSSQRERVETANRPYYRDYRCTRHAHPEKLLTADSGPKQAELVCVQHRAGRFWITPGQENGGNGYSYSAAHNAYAEDFPAGTRLVITAYVETPEQQQISTDGLDVAAESGEQP